MLLRTLLCSSFIRRFVGGYKIQPQLRLDKALEDEFSARFLNSGDQTSAWTQRDWTNLRDSILKSHKFITEVNVDATIIGLCKKYGNLSLGRSYMNYLKSVNQSPTSVAIIGKYVKLFELPAGEEQLPQDQVDEILSLCDSVRQRHPTLDANTAENLIYGLCLTPEWQKSVDLLAQIRIVSTPTHGTFNSIALAAFRNDDFNVALQMLEEAMVVHRLPSASSLIAWIEYCSRNNADIVELLEFLKVHNVQVSEAVSTRLTKLLLARGSHVKISTISKAGSCMKCSGHLEEISLTVDEFETLRNAFHERVLVRDNIFVKSTPQEFQDFNRFLSITGPYDCVIDGLNVAYSIGANKQANFLSGQVKSRRRF